MLRNLSIVLVTLAALLGSPAHARRLRPVVIKLPTFDLPPSSDREICTFVPLAMNGIDLSGWVIANHSGDQHTTSHHFIIYAYRGTDLASMKQYEGTVVDSQACTNLVPTPADIRFVGGAQTPNIRQRLQPHTAIRLDPVVQAAGAKPVTGLILNSHWINGATTSQTAHVKLTLLPSKKAPKQYQQPIFEVVANAFLKVPPGEIRNTSWHWDPGKVNLGGGQLGSVENPKGPACVTMVTGHMHHRGTLFLAEKVDAQGTATAIYQNTDYAEPAQRTFPTPMLVVPGEQIRYTCTQDNQTDVRMGCEETAGVTPGLSILESIRAGEFVHPAQLCKTDADCAGVGTGHCVPANLVFGFRSFDEMCILPGYYYDANAAGNCDL
jgi:hypothetical protein